jgi:hypothetical protein
VEDKTQNQKDCLVQAFLELQIESSGIHGEVVATLTSMICFSLIAL